MRITVKNRVTDILIMNDKLIDQSINLPTYLSLKDLNTNQSINKPIKHLNITFDHAGRRTEVSPLGYLDQILQQTGNLVSAQTLQHLVSQP